MSVIEDQSFTVATELIEKAKLESGKILVVGCSTSEVAGSPIGTNSNADIAEEIFSGLNRAANSAGVYLAVQCCEHLNRAIVIEAEAVPFCDVVNVVPQKKAGGALATVAYKKFSHPVVIEAVRADAGIDIGGTLIGMHLKPVAVPVRLTLNKIGEANIICARVRPKYIGGERAVYDKNLS